MSARRRSQDLAFRLLALYLLFDGYLLKGCPTEELVAAISRPASGPNTKI